MIRARSPFFGLTYLFAILLGIGSSWVLFTQIEPALAMEFWIKTTRLTAFRGVGWVLIAVGLVGLSAIGVVELRILRGWEPKWLRRFVPGCLVVDIYKQTSDPKEHRRIEIQSPQGWANWYILDSDEVGLCKVGDTIHLWAIGKHVAHLAVVDPTIIVYPPKARIASWARAMEQRQAGCAWFVMLLAPLLGGGLIGKGLEHLMFAELHFSGRSGRARFTPPRLATGFEAQFLGGVILFFGVLLAGFILYKWITGWQDEEFEALVELSLSSGRRRRGWWM